MIKLGKKAVITEQRLGRNMIILDTVELPAGHIVLRQTDRCSERHQDRPVLFLIQLQKPHEHLCVSTRTGT